MIVDNSFALTPQEQQQIANQQRIIQQQQEQQRQQEINQQQIDEAEKIRKTRSGIVGGSENANELFNTDDLLGDKSDTSKCERSFKMIKISGNSLYSTKTLKKKILDKYINKCMNRRNIQSLQNELMNFYIDRGYTNTRIYFDFNTNRQSYEELRNGVFNVIIEEGIVNDIILIDTRYNNKLEKKKLKQEEKQQREKEKQEQKEQQQENKKYNSKNKEIKQYKPIQESSFHRIRTNMQTFFAFPFLKGKVFNLKNYEQGLDQLNRLQSNNATMSIKANNEIKNEKLKIENEESKMIFQQKIIIQTIKKII